MATDISQRIQYHPAKGVPSVGALEQLMVESGNQLLVKCVVVGDQGVGKSHLVCSRASGVKYSLRELVLQTPVSSVWAVDQYRDNQDVRVRSQCDIDGVSCSLRIWDTFGNHDKDRQYAYLHTDVVIICFSAANKRSLINVEKFWIPEVHRMCGAVPIVVCGCQIDYRYLTTDPAYVKLEKGPFARKIKESDIVLPHEGREVARKIGASYYETSVLAQYGIGDVFSNAVRASLFHKKRSQIFRNIGNLKHVTKPHLQVPHLPPKPAQPEFEQPEPPPVGRLRPSRSRHDLQSYCDVTFIVHGGLRFYAHWAYLIAASPSFHQLYQRRYRPLDCSRSDFISMGRFSGGGSSSHSESSSLLTLNRWPPPWRRDGVRIRMSTRIRYLSQNFTAVPHEQCADDALSVDDAVTGSHSMVESTSDLQQVNSSERRRQSISSWRDEETNNDETFDQLSNASSRLTLKPLDDDEDDDDIVDDDVSRVDTDCMTQFSDVDSGYTLQTSQATSVTCLPSSAFVSVEVRSGNGGVIEETVVVIDDGISAATFEDVLHYIYTGNIPPEKECDKHRHRFERLNRAAIALGMADLEEATLNVLNGESFLNVDLRRQVEAERVRRIQTMFINQGLLADVTLELDDGTVPAHRALLMSRSDMMVSMFNLDFSERANKMVPFRGATTGGFRGLMHYLYTGICPDQCDDWASMIELADRLCLPQLLYDSQSKCVKHLNQLLTSLSPDTGELTEIVLALVEAAKLHKADQIERWCRWYLQVNFNEVNEKHAKIFEALSPETKDSIVSRRWPPEWYLVEVQVYEKALMLMTKERPEASWLRRPNGEVHDPTHCFGFLRKKK